MDVNAIAQQLLDAIQAASDASVKGLDATRRNTFAQINNRNNQRGALYSTQGGQQKTQWNANTYTPTLAKYKQQPLTARFAVASQLQTMQQKIDSLNRAANELNGIQFDY